ncbi:MAG: universal stress protein [Flavobacteriales bacterium]
MKNIIAATDFSKSSLNAVRYAAELALHFGAQLTLVHAAHLPIVNESQPDVTLYFDEILEADSQRLEKLLEQLRREYGPALKIKELVKMGFAAEVIKEASRKANVDLAIFGISHLDKFSRLIFGSTSLSVAGRLRCPVLIIPENARFKFWNRVAFAFDQHDIPVTSGTKVLKSMLDTFQSEWHFVHVDDEPFPETGDKNVAKFTKTLGVNSFRVHHLLPVKYKRVEVLKDWVRRYKSNTVVMTAHEHNLFYRLLNESSTRKMAFETTVPLMILAESKK